ncbi:hypothetical protein IOD13_16280 [Brevibacterium casei]|nr:hypothetical protein [Brevibacterium casei]
MIGHVRPAVGGRSSAPLELGVEVGVLPPRRARPGGAEVLLDLTEQRGGPL